MVNAKTILVVDDTLDSLKLLSDLLRDEGFVVLPANSGELALAAINATPPDLVLLDILMPGMDGFEVLRRLKENKDTAHIPVIFLSATAETNQRVGGFRSGAVDFVAKPFHREELLARVRTHIDLSLAISEVEKKAADLKLVNERLLKTQDQLLQSEKMASIGQLAAGVAHELNNPIGFVQSNLGTLAGYVEDLLEIINHCEKCSSGCAIAGKFDAFRQVCEQKDLPFLKEDVRQLLAESKDGTDRVRHIVQNLKDFSHVSEDEWQWADLHKGIESTLNLVWNELKYKAEVIKAYGDLPDVYCLASQINQVIMNLLVNAAQAIETHGTITITTGVQEAAGDAGQQVWIEIGDTGKGIPPENLNRIFEPFFTTKPVGKGTGLGLSLAWGIVQKHHGTLEARSKVGEGTTFRITLPVKGEAAG